MHQIIKQYIKLGQVLGVKSEDIAGQFPTMAPQVTVKAPEPATIIKVEPTGEEALRLHNLHRNWATVARLMGMKKQEVLALVHKVDSAPVKPKANEELSAAKATRITLNSKKYRTMKEIIAEVRGHNLQRPAYTGAIKQEGHRLVRNGLARVHKEMGQLTGYKLVG